MANKILIDEKDFVLLNAVKIYMALDNITHDNYIETMSEHSQASLSDLFSNFDPASETVVTVTKRDRQAYGGSGGSQRAPSRLVV